MPTAKEIAAAKAAAKAARAAAAKTDIENPDTITAVKDCVLHSSKGGHRTFNIPKGESFELNEAGTSYGEGLEIPLLSEMSEEDRSNFK